MERHAVTARHLRRRHLNSELALIGHCSDRHWLETNELCVTPWPQRLRFEYGMFDLRLHGSNNEKGLNGVLELIQYWVVIDAKKGMLDLAATLEYIVEFKFSAVCNIGNGALVRGCKRLEF